MDQSEPHVHFNALDKEDAFSEKEIDLEIVGPHKANVHLGFLSIHHKYVVEVRLPSQLLPSKEPSDIEQKHLNPPTLHCRFLKARLDQESGQVIVSLEFLANKAGIQKETIQIQDRENESTPTTLTLIARVMGKGKGTPLLRVGVHLLHALDDPDESDVNSDWKGF